MLSVAWSGAFLVSAQGTRSDYERANQLRDITSGKVFKQAVKPHWLSGKKKFWYRNDLAEGQREWVLVDPENRKRSAAFDHPRLATALAAVIEQKVEARRLPIESLSFSDDESALVIAVGDTIWKCDLNTYAVSQTKATIEPTPTIQREKRFRRSRRAGEETWLKFDNRTPAEVELFWIDAEGEAKRYAAVKSGAKYRQHTFAGHVWLVKNSEGNSLGVYVATEGNGEVVIDSQTPIELDPPSRSNASGKPQGRVSPNGEWSAFIEAHNLYLRHSKGGAVLKLSQDGNAEDFYSEQIFWAPDSTRLVCLRTRPGEERKAHFVESSPKDQLQPKLHTFAYAKPGDRLAISKPRLFELPSGQVIAINDELFPNPWSLSDVRWLPDSSRFTFIYNQRGHQVLRVISVDARSGKATAIVDEQSQTFIDYAHKQYLHFLDETQELIWMSERDGWNHLYLYEAKTGQVKNQITQGEWGVRGVDRVDAKRRQIWFQTGGIHPGRDPYYLHYCRVNFDGSGLVALTEGDGTHQIQFSPDDDYFIDTWSRVDLPPITELRRSRDGALVCDLEQADGEELLQTGWQTPERFVAKGRDGETDIYGVIYRPTTFDPARRYPVIEKIYAGPHGSFVPKAFAHYHAAQSLAELGFIVVQIDGMGTSHRSKTFHNVCWKNLGDSGFPDRMLWIKAAAAQYPYMDLSRVGIYGGSAGGQSSTRALLAHPEFYHVAVSDCGCHDNRLDKIWWNELWMGWPIGPHYAEQSNVTQAHKLQGKLLLIVGEMDRNVDPASTMQVVNALIKADKDFDFLIVPGGGHGIAESQYGKRRRRDFFVRHLLGVEPRSLP